MDAAALARRRAQNLSSPRTDARAVAPSIRSFAQAIDRQRAQVERIPVLRATRPDLLQAATALDSAEVVALAFSIDDPQAELRAFAQAARAVTVPVLRTDLLLEEFQIYETRAAGGDAVLLVAAALPGELLARLCAVAASTHMTSCVLCEDAAELARAVAARAAVVALRDLSLPVPRRTLVLALSDAISGADALLDASLGESADPAAEFRRHLDGAAL
jgi:indole-3-glycerol phosphate synthase